MKKLILLLLIPFMTFSQNFNETIIADANNWVQPKVIDLDNDGLDDLVSVSRDGNVAWWKKDVTFNYTKISIAETSKSWNHFDVADIDGDSDLDILVSEQNSIEIYYNDGSENFTPTYINANSLSSNIIAGDFDADGYVDFITTSRGQNGPIRFWKNILNIGFQPSTVTNVEITAGDILVNDIDNDGDLDLVMSVSSGFWTGNHILCFLNDGNANFTERTINYTQSNEHLQILDYDNDGNKDLVVKQGNCCLVLFTNDGNLNFTATELTNDADLESMRIVDFDNDGDLDISVVFSSLSNSDFFGFYINDGSGNFTLFSLENLEQGERIQSLDYNNDGMIDFLVTSSAFDDPRLYENIGSGSFNLTILDDSFVSPTSFYIDDIDNDGLKDVISTSSNEGELVLWHNTGSFNFTKTVIDNTELLISYAHVDDINGDGHKDILISTFGFNEGEVLLYTNDGNLNFSKSTLFAVTGVERAFATDLNNDTHLDIIITRPAGSNGQIFYYLNDGNGNYQQQYVDAIPEFKVCTDFIDINNDGIKDITTDGAFYFQNDGNLNFTQVSLPTEGTLFDIDRDGDLDVLGSNYDFANSSNIIAWFENDGNGNFTEQQIQTGNATNSRDIFTIQDFDGDGDIDFVSCPTNSFNSQQLSFWVNDGSQTFTSSVMDANYATLNLLLSDDLDGDGDIDVISSNNKFPFTIWNNTSDIPLSIGNQKEVTVHIRIFPNPTSDIVYISSNEIITQADIYNIQGQKMDFSMLNNIIDLTNLPKGMYILKLKTREKRSIFKIIKN
ncbi:MAG: T9SS type A sorting domain-containing protein [Bacteroidota bacterium]